MNFWQAIETLSGGELAFLLIALAVAFGFEFINGFHDTANAVTTVIYTRTLRPLPAVLYSGFLNFLGVLIGGTGVAFGIVHLLPVDLLVASKPSAALVMVMALLLSGVIWNLGTWYIGLPVSSSHTLIGSILGVGIAHGAMSGQGIYGVNWNKATEVGAALLVSPMFGFVAVAILYLIARKVFRNPKLYEPPVDGERAPGYVRWTLLGTCGAVSFAHGSNDGQKGMGIILLVLIGFLPMHYALDTSMAGGPEKLAAVAKSVRERAEKQGPLPETLQRDLELIVADTEGKQSLGDIDERSRERWELRRAILRVSNDKARTTSDERKVLRDSVEFVPLWVIVGTAFALGIGTTVGYKRIVITVAEKIGTTHLTYAQGAAAEMVAAFTILMAVYFKLPVSTTHVLSSGVAGGMWAAGSSLQKKTVTKILSAWVLTLPATMTLSGALYLVGRQFAG